MAKETLFVETDRMRIRFVEFRDIEKLNEMNRNPNVMKYITNGETESLEETQAGMDRMLKRRQKYSDRFGDFVAIRKGDSELLGWFCLRPPHEEPENTSLIEIGWRLKEEHWGKGYATEGARALLDVAIENYKTPVVFAMAMEGNVASIRVMKKLGMTYKKEFLYDDFPGENKKSVWYEYTNPGESE